MIHKTAKFKDLINISITENREEMVNISKELTNCVCIPHKLDMEKYTGQDIWVRKTVKEKLNKIAIKLQNKFPGYKLKVVYGYRHPDIQNKYFEERKLSVKNEHPYLSENELIELTHTMVAYPSVAGHSTGGAVDLTIITPFGDLDMGTKIADYKDTEKITTFSKNLSLEQENNRKLLDDLMVNEGFASFYGEWWHFSYGDKEWAWFYSKPNALYKQIKFQKK